MLLNESRELFIAHEAAYTNFLKNLATGDIDSEIKEIEEDVRDVKTVVQQRLVMNKIAEMMYKLVALRHNSTFVRHSVDKLGNFFHKLFNKNDPSKELNLRLGEAISKLDRLKNACLGAIHSDNKEAQDAVEKLRAKFVDTVKEAEKKKLETVESGEGVDPDKKDLD